MKKKIVYESTTNIDRLKEKVDKVIQAFGFNPHDIYFISDGTSVMDFIYSLRKLKRPKVTKGGRICTHGIYPVSKNNRSLKKAEKLLGVSIEPDELIWKIAERL